MRRSDGREVCEPICRRGIPPDIEVRPTIHEKAFVSDVQPVPALGVSFDPIAAGNRVLDAFISQLPEAPSKKGGASRK